MQGGRIYTNTSLKGRGRKKDDHHTGRGRDIGVQTSVAETNCRDQGTVLSYDETSIPVFGLNMLVGSIVLKRALVSALTYLA